MEHYEITIETQERFTNEDGETKCGPVRVSHELFEAHSVTEAAVFANKKRNSFNNVNVNRV